ncbi:MAG: hypothetical protein ACWGN7_04750, partial [Thermodesulfovibrionales bacterium]
GVHDRAHQRRLAALGREARLSDPRARSVRGHRAGSTRARVKATIRLLFHVHMKGTVLSLVPGAALYVLINVSIGLLVSSVTRTMVSAQVVTIIVTVIPAFLYSGLLIPVANLGREAKA